MKIRNLEVGPLSKRIKFDAIPEGAIVGTPTGTSEGLFVLGLAKLGQTDSMTALTCAVEVGHRG